MNNGIKKKIRVGIIAGGWSAEREVSLKSGYAVYKALDKDKYEVILWDIKEDLDVIVKKRSEVDVIFPLLHGKRGEDGAIQGFLNTLGVAFVGSDILASAISMNKKISKQLFQANGLDVAKGIYIEKEDILNQHAIDELKFPVVVKPVSEGSSFGISICYKKEELEQALKEAFKYDNEALIEEYIEGKEITAPVIGYKKIDVLPLVEIVPKKGHKFFDFEAKYRSGETDEICPARISCEQEKKVKEVAKRAFNAIGCKIWARVDMILKEDKVYVLEVNTIPGMTENSLFPLSAKKAGMRFSELLDKLISLSISAYGER